MIKLKNTNDKLISEINMTPLIDVMLVLLVIFMITVPILTTSIDINLPKTSKSKNSSEKDDPLVISINKNRQIFLGDVQTDIKTLKFKLSAIAEINSKTNVYLKADKSLPYQFIIDIIGVVNNAGFSQISLVSIK